MTLTAGRPHMLVTGQGRPSGRTPPDGNTARALQWLTRACVRERSELWLNSRQGLAVGARRERRARPDGTLAPS
ncbi:hypothetical protein ACFUVV_11335 [Streptomyces sp. NPDC057376]|uniref:hypothetical protein n=1 Tax=unclassified Streptomyces TaxID=2593676 RepID=UPI00093DB8F8|nr:hypothetical protein [Streptomyces sp. CB02414]